MKIESSEVDYLHDKNADKSAFGPGFPLALERRKLQK